MWQFNQTQSNHFYVSMWVGPNQKLTNDSPGIGLLYQKSFHNVKLWIVEGVEGEVESDISHPV